MRYHALTILLCCALPLQARANFLTDKVASLLRPASKLSAKRGPDRADRIHTISTDPNRHDTGLEFPNRERFLQPHRRFSVVNPAAPGGRRPAARGVGDRWRSRWEQRRRHLSVGRSGQLPEEGRDNQVSGEDGDVQHQPRDSDRSGRCEYTDERSAFAHERVVRKKFV